MSEEQTNSNEQSNEQVLAIEVEGKKYTADDIKNIRAQQASATQKTQEVAAIKKMVESLGMSVDQFVPEAQRVFESTANLVRDGIITEDLQPVRRNVPKPDIPYSDNNMGFNFQPQGYEQSKPNPADEALKGISQEMGGLKKQVSQLQEHNAMLLKMNIANEITRQHKDLTMEEAQSIIDASTRDSFKNMDEHIGTYKQRRDKMMTDQETRFASKYGIDLNKWNANKLKEQDAKGGAGGLFKNKKFSFTPSKDGNSVSPRTALKEFMEQRSRG